MSSTQHRPSRPRRPLTIGEREAIRGAKRQNPSWSQSRLAEWASVEFNRRIRQTVISDALRPRRGTGDTVIYELADNLTGRSAEVQTRTEKDRYGLTRTGQQLPTTTPQVPSAATRGPSTCLSYRTSCAKTSVQEGQATEEHEDRLLSRIDSRGQTGFHHLKKLRSGHSGAWAQEPKIVAVEMSNMYLTQFFSRFVSPSISMSGPKPVEDLTRWVVGVHHRASVTQNGPLNDALRCVLVRHAGITTGDDRVVTGSKSLYGQALRSVQRAINAGGNMVNRDLVSAIMLLGFFEVFNYREGARDPYPDHMRGARQIVQQLGPSQFLDNDGHDILLAFTGQLLYSFPKRDPVDFFVASSEWAPALRLGQRDDPHEQSDATIALSVAAVELSIQMIALRRESYLRKLPSKHVQTNIQFANRLLQLSAEIHRWGARFQTTIPPLPPSVTQERGARFAQRPYIPSYIQAAGLWCAGIAMIRSMDDLLAKFGIGGGLVANKKMYDEALEKLATLLPMNALQAKRSISVWNIP